MCVFNRRPSPPPLPEPRPTAPPPEKTAQRVVVGAQRTGTQTSRKRIEGLSRGRRKQSSIRSARRVGTNSLIIPLASQRQTGLGNLNY